MAKRQTFADKARGKDAKKMVNVKVVKTVKTDRGSFKFNESFVKLDDVSKVTTIN